MTLTIQALSLEIADMRAHPALEFVTAQHIIIAIAIIDNHGNLQLLKRMDGNNFVSARMTQLKAMTSASIPISTKALAERNSTYANSPYSSVPDVVLLEEGLPIISKASQHLGAIGISGANPELDGQCAQAALEAIQDYL